MGAGIAFGIGGETQKILFGTVSSVQTDLGGLPKFLAVFPIASDSYTAGGASAYPAVNTQFSATFRYGSPVGTATITVISNGFSISDVAVGAFTYFAVM